MYTDDDEILFDEIRPIVANGIEDIATRGDLADRAIAITLPVISDGDRRPESEIWSIMQRERARILGALCDAVSIALREIDSVRIDALPRMADFARWAAAAAPALGSSAEEFLLAYADNRQASAEAVLEDPIAQLIIGLDLERPGWEGTASDLLDALASRASDRQRQARGWPQTPRGLSGRVRRLAPTLRRAGIEILYRRLPGDDRRRVLSIDRVRSQPSRPSRPSESFQDREIARDGFGTVGSDCRERPSQDDLFVSQSDSAARDGRDGRSHTLFTRSEDWV